MTTHKRLSIFVMVAVAWLAVSGPVVAQEASMLDVSDASAFLAEWVLNMETPRGNRERNLALTDVGGKVAAELSGGRGGTVSVTDISKSGSDLVLSFEFDRQGNTVPVTLTLGLDGDMLKATQDVNDGLFTMSGTGSKR